MGLTKEGSEEWVREVSQEQDLQEAHRVQEVPTNGDLKEEKREAKEV